PFQPRLGQERHAIAWLDPQLAQAQRDRPHPLLRLPVRDRGPGAARLVTESGGVARILLHGIEEQPRQGARVHGRNLTTKVMGEPGTAVPIARRAAAVTTALSGSGPARRRSLTTAMPEAVVRVSLATGRRAGSDCCGGRPRSPGCVPGWRSPPGRPLPRWCRSPP